MRDRVSSEKNEKENCGICEKIVRERDNGIKCDRCGAWYHAGCEKVSVEFYKALQKCDEEQWYCKLCRSEIKQLDERIKTLAKENKELKVRIQALEEKWELFKEELKEETVKCTMERVSQEMEKHLEEMEERSKRKNNIVLYNVPESTKEDSKERQTDDLVKCCDLFEGSLKVSDIRIEGVIRMGKKENGRKRPLLVKLANEREKKSILANAKNLKGEENPWKKRVGISKDMTKKERDQDIKAREELKAKRAAGDQTWYIKNGKLQKREGEVKAPPPRRI